MEETNIDDLLSILELSETILNYNSEIKNDIVSNGGSVIYSYNNIILATEISDELYAELKKSSYIDYIEEVPLKKYGDIEPDLIDQLDISKLTGVTSTDITTSSDVYGGVDEDIIKNIIDGEIVITQNGIPPTITNTDFTLSALTNDWFTFPISVNGTLQLEYDYTKPTNYIGELMIYHNSISGTTSESGIYNIDFKVSNDYGFDSKKLVLSIYEPVKITNTNLIVNNKFGSDFTYTIESIGSDITYNVHNIPSGIILTENTLSGIFITGGTYIMNINISGTTGYDSKLLTVNVGVPPIITSSGQISCQQYSGLTYNITPSVSDTVYTIIGLLPKGLQLTKSGDIYSITGSPTESGIFNVKIKAKNPNGETKKNLAIIISEINIGWIINKY
jgi:hypothetical protein